VRRLRRTGAIVFAGDRRVWHATALALVPVLALLAYYGLHSRPYYTGTNSVEAVAYVAQTPAGEPVCIGGLEIPAPAPLIEIAGCAAQLPTHHAELAPVGAQPDGDDTDLAFAPETASGASLALTPAGCPLVVH